MKMAPPNMQPLTRLVTTHNAEGKAVFSDAVGDHAEQKAVGNEVHFGLQYCSEGFPTDMNADRDIEVYREYSQKAPGLVIGNGTVLRSVGTLNRAPAP